MGVFRRIWSVRLLYLMFFPGLLYFVLFKYLPMFGILIAFKDYNPFQGVFASEWVGMKHFVQLFSDSYFYGLLKNTFLLAFYTLLFGFPIPILFSLLLNEVKMTGLKRFIQTLSFFPYFISSAVAVGIVYTFLSPQSGFVNVLLNELFGMDPIPFMSEPRYFRTIYVSLEVWKNFGYGAIIYLAAIAGVEQSLYEAAEIDGASRWRRMWHVTLPGIRNTIIVLFILNIGSILNVSLDTILVLYNPSVYDTADVLQSYVYRRGFGVDSFPNFSFATTVGLFQSVVAFILIVSANAAAKRITDTRLF